MSNRINKLFEEKQDNILSIYFTAGYPNLNDTVSIIETLEKEGVNLIEIGMPFSDPAADGPVIQKSSEIALKNGMSLSLLFEQIKDIRKSVNIPLVLMGYFNPVFQYGVEKFCQKCLEIGIDGVILPDMPLDEYTQNYQLLFENANLHNILLITPQTSSERIKQIDTYSSGFIYMVSSSSTTGKVQKVEDFHTDYFNRVNSLNLQSPKIIGFGISDHSTFANACKYANGAIIGTAFIKALDEDKPLKKKISGFIQNIVNPR